MVAEVDVTCIGRVVEFVVALYIAISPTRSPSAIRPPASPRPPLHSPLIASPHTEDGGGEAHGHSRRSQRGAHTTNCPAWCIGYDADGPDGTDDHVHEATPALIPCITLERTTNETGTILHHPTATELTLVRYQYPHDSDTWLYIGDGSRSHGLDITLESARRLVSALARYVEDEGGVGWGRAAGFPTGDRCAVCRELSTQC